LAVGEHVSAGPSRAAGTVKCNYFYFMILLHIVATAISIPIIIINHNEFCLTGVKKEKKYGRWLITNNNQQD
jgi:uncharacterized membrane protein YozB (DUF420 family)